MFSLQQIGEVECRKGFTYKWLGGGVAQTTYTHVSKCKNDKIKRKKKKFKKQQQKNFTHTCSVKFRHFKYVFICSLLVFFKLPCF
jgi:hypothetical protein